GPTASTTRRRPARWTRRCRRAARSACGVPPASSSTAAWCRARSPSRASRTSSTTSWPPRSSLWEPGRPPPAPATGAQAEYTARARGPTSARGKGRRSLPRPGGAAREEPSRGRARVTEGYAARARGWPPARPASRRRPLALREDAAAGERRGRPRHRGSRTSAGDDQARLAGELEGLRDQRQGRDRGEVVRNRHHDRAAGLSVAVGKPAHIDGHLDPDRLALDEVLDVGLGRRAAARAAADRRPAPSLSRAQRL